MVHFTINGFPGVFSDMFENPNFGRIVRSPHDNFCGVWHFDFAKKIVCLRLTSYFGHQNDFHDSPRRFSRLAIPPADDASKRARSYSLRVRSKCSNARLLTSSIVDFCSGYLFANLLIGTSKPCDSASKRTAVSKISDLFAPIFFISLDTNGGISGEERPSRRGRFRLDMICFRVCGLCCFRIITLFGRSRRHEHFTSVLRKFA